MITAAAGTSPSLSIFLRADKALAALEGLALADRAITSESAVDTSADASSLITCSV
jgi:hypothetical protein